MEASCKIILTLNTVDGFGGFIFETFICPKSEADTNNFCRIFCLLLLYDTFLKQHVVLSFFFNIKSLISQNFIISY